MTTIAEPLRDYSEPLVAARLDLDPLSHALATRDYVAARLLAERIRANLDQVIEWIGEQPGGEPPGITMLIDEQSQPRYIDLDLDTAADTAAGALGVHASPSIAPILDDLEHRDFPICPHCAQVHVTVASWDFAAPPEREASGSFVCSNCHSTMFVRRHVTITYTTEAR